MPYIRLNSHRQCIDNEEIHMTTNPGDSLTQEEFASLGQFAKGPLATEVPSEHAEKLSNLGFITKIAANTSSPRRA
jgi:hypothetical protein